MIYHTWEELADSQDFEHGQQFVKAEDYREIRERIKMAEKLMGALWSVANFTDKPTLITGTIGQYREKYPEAI